jgi:membrane protease YdiL (CAAX protease family)
MNKLKRFATARPVLFSLVLIVIYALLSTLTYPVHFLFPDNEVGQVYGDAVAKIVISAVFVGMLWRFGWLERSGLTRLGERRGRFLIAAWGAYLIFGQYYAFTDSIRPPVASSPLGIAEFLGTLPGALLEELLYRGLLLTAMMVAWGHSRRGIVKSVALSSLLFGSTHLINVLVRPVGIVVAQAILVSLPGVFYAVVLLKRQSLWPAILIHWLANAAVNVKIAGLESFQETPTMWLWFAVFMIPIALYSVYVLWKLPVVEMQSEVPRGLPPEASQGLRRVRSR